MRYWEARGKLAVKRFIVSVVGKKKGGVLCKR